MKTLENLFIIATVLLMVCAPFAAVLIRELGINANIAFCVFALLAALWLGSLAAAVTMLEKYIK